jgi:hypothetical protein
MHIVSEIRYVSQGRHVYWAGKTSRRLRMVLSPCFLLKAWFAKKVSSLGRARRHLDRPRHDVRQVFEDTNNPRRSRVWERAAKKAKRRTCRILRYERAFSSDEVSGEAPYRASDTHHSRVSPNVVNAVVSDARGDARSPVRLTHKARYG